MELLFALLTAFTLNPTYDRTVQYTKQQTIVAQQMIKKSGYLKECSITGLLGNNKTQIVLGMVCADKKGVYKARMGIDMQHKIYIRTR